MERILCIVDSLNTGGAETFLMKLSRALDKNKYQMDFIASDKGYYDKEVVNAGGRVHYIPFRTKKPFVAFRMIKDIVKQGRYKIVIKLGSTPIAAIDLLAARKGGAETLGLRSCNSYAEEGTVYKIINTMCKPLLKSVVNLKIAPSDLAAIFTFGEQAYKNNEVNILHNAVDLEYFKFDGKKRNETRKLLGLTENDTIYGHIGRFSNQKNHTYLIDIFKNIKERDESAKFILVGTGELESEIKDKVNNYHLSEDVLFLGVRNDIPNLLSVFDLFVFPSFYEGMPNTVVEAQATGLPCIISDRITRQSNITGLVEFLPIDVEPEVWAEKCVKHKKERIDTTQVLQNSGYNINIIVQEFLKMTVGDKCEN